MYHRAGHRALAVVLAGALIPSCTQRDVVAVDIAIIDVQPESFTLEPGQTRALYVSLESEDGEELSGRTIEWSSEDSDVATVDAQGRVTALGEGVVRIVARAEGAEGAATVRVEVPPDQPANRPSAPARLRVQQAGKTNLLLKWQDTSDDETHFVVQRAHSIVSGWAWQHQLPANADGYMDRDLEEEHRYWYRVLACNGAGCSASEVVTERTRDD